MQSFKSYFLTESTGSIEDFINSIKPQLIAGAQQVYDDWEQDEEGVFV